MGLQAKKKKTKSALVPKIAYARDGNVYGMHIQYASDLACAEHCHICEDAARHVCK